MWREGYLSRFRLVAAAGNSLKGLAWISPLFSWDSEVSWILRQKSTHWGIRLKHRLKSWRTAGEEEKWLQTKCIEA